MSTSKIDPMIYRLHARTEQYRERHARLFGELRRQLDKTCYVSFSAGKDSTVCAHACNVVMPGIPILLVDPGCPTHWLESERAMWERYVTAHAWNYRRFPWQKWKRGSESEEGDEYRRKVHASQFVELEKWANRNGFTRRVMGLRGDESRTRRLSLGSDRGVSERRLCPISLWSTDDVWAYIIMHELPWLSIYDFLGPDARNGLIGKNGSARGRLAYLKFYYPEAYRTARGLFAADDLR